MTLGTWRWLPRDKCKQRSCTCLCRLLHTAVAGDVGLARGAQQCVRVGVSLRACVRARCNGRATKLIRRNLGPPRMLSQWSDASCVVYVYDCGNEASFASIENWIQRTKEAAGGRDDIPGAQATIPCLHGCVLCADPRVHSLPYHARTAVCCTDPRGRHCFLGR